MKVLIETITNRKGYKNFNDIDSLGKFLNENRKKIKSYKILNEAYNGTFEELLQDVMKRADLLGNMIGYCRISTSQQTLLNQRHEIQAFAEKNNLKIDKWLDEVISSRKPLNERKLGKLLKKLKKGDVLIATELSRLGRNLLEVMGILQQCLERECQIWTLKENYRLGSDISSKVLAFAFSLASEIERQLISDRTRNSLQRLKDEGKHLGRPYGFTYKKLEKKHNKIKELLDKNVSKAEIARLIGCTWATLHRYINESIVNEN